MKQTMRSIGTFFLLLIVHFLILAIGALVLSLLFSALLSTAVGQFFVGHLTGGMPDVACILVPCLMSYAASNAICKKGAAPIVARVFGIFIVLLNLLFLMVNIAERASLIGSILQITLGVCVACFIPQNVRETAERRPKTNKDNDTSNKATLRQTLWAKCPISRLDRLLWARVIMAAVSVFFGIVGAIIYTTYSESFHLFGFFVVILIICVPSIYHLTRDKWMDIRDYFTIGGLYLLIWGSAAYLIISNTLFAIPRIVLGILIALAFISLAIGAFLRI